MGRLDGVGYEDFVRIELGRLSPLARALTGNEHDAGDLVQECLVRVGLRWDSIEQCRDVHAYARTALIRLHLNRLRRLRREVLTARSDEPAPYADFADGIVNTDWLLRCLSSLSPEQRAVVALRYLEDLPLAEIAEHLHRPIGTVKSQLNRALTTLKINQLDPSIRFGGTHADRRRTKNAPQRCLPYASRR